MIDRENESSKSTHKMNQIALANKCTENGMPAQKTLESTNSFITKKHTNASTL